MASAKSPEKTQEELDEEELREIEGKIHEILELMTKRKSRDETDEILSRARQSAEESTNNPMQVIHIHKSYHAPTTMHTKTRLDLAEHLKTRISLGKYARKLDDSLRRLSERYVEVLERILTRSRY
jgi:sulfopyruvate decarboxylase TPP-binding subunit